MLFGSLLEHFKNRIDQKVKIEIPLCLGRWEDQGNITLHFGYDDSASVAIIFIFPIGSRGAHLQMVERRWRIIE